MYVVPAETSGELSSSLNHFQWLFPTGGLLEPMPGYGSHFKHLPRGHAIESISKAMFLALKCLRPLRISLPRRQWGNICHIKEQVLSMPGLEKDLRLRSGQSGIYFASPKYPAQSGKKKKLLLPSSSWQLDIKKKTFVAGPPSFHRAQVLHVGLSCPLGGHTLLFGL